MANAIFGPGSENQIPLATITSSVGTQDPDYPLDGLTPAGIPCGIKQAMPRAKFTTTTADAIMDFGSAKSVPIFGMPDYYITAGAVVKIQGNATNTWGSPSLSQMITIPAHQRNGFPIGVFKDLSGGSHSFRYWRLVVESGNSVNVQLGQFWMMSTKRTLIQNVRWGVKPTNMIQQVEHETDGGVEHIYPFGTQREDMTAQIKTSLGDGAIAQFEDWYYDGSKSGYFLFILDPDSPKSRVCRFHMDYGREYTTYNDDTVDLVLRERSRGLRP